jgi:hypothetical protein
MMNARGAAWGRRQPCARSRSGDGRQESLSTLDGSPMIVSQAAAVPQPSSFDEHRVGDVARPMPEILISRRPPASFDPTS